MGTLPLEESFDEDDFESAPTMSAQSLADLLGLPYPPKIVKRVEESSSIRDLKKISLQNAPQKAFYLKAALLTRKK